MRITNINNTWNIAKTGRLAFKKQIDNEVSNNLQQFKLPIYPAFFKPALPNFLLVREQSGKREFIDFLSNIKVDNIALIKQVKDFGFAYSKNLDEKSWTNFLSEMNESVAVFDSTGEEKTFLTKLVEIHSIDKLLNNPNFKPDKAIEFLDKLYERTDEEISEIPFTAQLDFMVDAATSDEDITEYIDDMFYFVQLEDINGNRFLSEYAGEMNRTKTDVIKHLLKVDKGSVEASNVQMLLELVQNGVVGAHVFDCIPFDGKINSFVVDDIDKLYEAYLDGIRPIDAFVMPVDSHLEARILLEVGDVYELSGEENIFILDKDLKPMQLGIDKKTYFELFPPIERYSTTQNDIGNCWEITAFNTLLTDPKERVSVLSLFKQNGDAISIQFPSNNAGEIVFEDGELPSNAKSDYYSNGPKGIQLLEYAHGIEEHESQIKTLRQQMEYSISSAKTEDRKKELEDKLNIFNEMLSEDRDNVVISFDTDKLEWSFESWESSQHGFDNAVTCTRDGGDPILLFKKLGYTVTSITDDDEKISKLISNPKNFEEYIITFGTKADEFLAPKDTLLINDHSYRLYPSKIDEMTGKVVGFKLVDPSGIIETQMDHTTLKKYNGIYSVARRDKTDKSIIVIK